MKKALKYLTAIINLRKIMESTNKQLFTLFEEKTQLQESFFGLLLRDKFERFTKDNETAHKAIYDALLALNKKYFVHDGEVMVLSKPPLYALHDKHGNRSQHIPKPILNDTLTMMQYEEEFAVLMAHPCEIII